MFIDGCSSETSERQTLYFDRGIFNKFFFQYPYLDYLKNKKVTTKTLSVLLYRSPCVPLFVNLLKTTKSVQKQSDSIFQLKNESQFSNF